MKNGTKIVMALAGSLGLASTALATKTVQLDVNALNLTASGAGFPASPTDPISAAAWESYWTGYSGTLTFSLNGANPSVLNGILIEGVTQTHNPLATLTGFTGSITLVGGVVTGGGYTVTVSDPGSGTPVDTYSAVIESGTGIIAHVMSGGGGAGQPGFTYGSFSINGMTHMGFFSSGDFAGVDVSDWFAHQPLRGSFSEIKFNPNGAGTDTNADVDIFAVVPLPGPAAMGLAGMLGLGVIRRRTA